MEPTQVPKVQAEADGKQVSDQVVLTDDKSPGKVAAGETPSPEEDPNKRTLEKPRSKPKPSPNPESEGLGEKTEDPGTGEDKPKSTGFLGGIIEGVRSVLDAVTKRDPGESAQGNSTPESEPQGDSHSKPAPETQATSQPTPETKREDTQNPSQESQPKDCMNDLEAKTRLISELNKRGHSSLSPESLAVPIYTAAADTIASLAQEVQKLEALAKENEDRQSAARVRFLKSLSRLSQHEDIMDLSCTDALDYGTKFFEFVTQKAQQIQSRSDADEARKNLVSQLANFQPIRSQAQISCAQAMRMASSVTLEINRAFEEVQQPILIENLAKEAQATTSLLLIRKKELERFQEVAPARQPPERPEFADLRDSLTDAKVLDFKDGKESLLPILMLLYKIRKELKRQQGGPKGKNSQAIERLDQVINAVEGDLNEFHRPGQAQAPIVDKLILNALQIHPIEDARLRSDDLLHRLTSEQQNLIKCQQELQAKNDLIQGKDAQIQKIQAEITDKTHDNGQIRRELTKFQADLEGARDQIRRLERDLGEHEKSLLNSKAVESDQKELIAGQNDRMREMKFRIRFLADDLYAKEKELNAYKEKEEAWARERRVWDRATSGAHGIQPDLSSSKFIREVTKDTSWGGTKDNKSTLVDEQPSFGSPELSGLIDEYKASTREFTTRVSQGLKNINESRTDRNAHVKTINENVQVLKNELKEKTALRQPLVLPSGVTSGWVALPWVLLGLVLLSHLRQVCLNV